ncbi:hypothetical protein [Paraburkholderia sp. BCC1885]|uniref:hypothetical protein n=1 Tax=Paraburkholderia sp. BCC1885 TaxID=2562669 RepID=UPI001181E320|nr:hypothetical protein [Paraburkholderia sp. BCC1885]
MENALHAARTASGEADGRRVELTPSGWLAIALAIGGAAVSAWVGYQHFAAAVPVRSPQVAVTAAQPQSVAQAGSAATGMPSVALLTQALARERRERDIQNVAWRALNELSKQQIASLRSDLQALDGRIDVLGKTPPPAPAPARAGRSGVADVASGARALHAALDAAKASTDIDVASLPVETSSAQTLNVTGFGNGVVEIGDQKLTVGQPYQPGETIVAVDPVSRSIVTTRRIINVTN